MRNLLLGAGAHRKESAGGSIQRVLGFSLANRSLQKEEGDACKKSAAPRDGERLKVETQSELHTPGRMSSGQVHERRTAETGINGVCPIAKLGMVE